MSESAGQRSRDVQTRRREMSEMDKLINTFGFLLPTNMKEFTMVDYLDFFAILTAAVLLLYYFSKTKTFQKLIKKIEWLF